MCYVRVPDIIWSNLSGVLKLAIEKSIDLFLWVNYKTPKRKQVEFLGGRKRLLDFLKKSSYMKFTNITEYPENGKIIHLKKYGNALVLRQLLNECTIYL